MSIRSRVTSLLRNIVLRRRVEQDLDHELRAYLEMAADEQREAGLSDDEARRTALVELGGVEQVRESVRDVRAGAMIEQLRQDLGYAFRMLWRNRGLTAVAVVTLALGIGANSAIFTIVDTVVLRRLPYQDADRLVKVWGSTSAAPTDNVSLPDYLDIRDESDVFDMVAADDGAQFTIAPGHGSRLPIAGAQVTGGWLEGLGVQPIVGRAFAPNESTRGNDRVVLLTYSCWQHRFAGDRSVVGRTLPGEDGPYTVIGVLPPNVLRYANDFLKPLVESTYSHDRGYHDLDVFGRLKPGVSIAQARAQLDAIASRLQRQYPDTNRNLRFNVAPLDKSYALTDARANRALVLMLGAVGLVLLIACANVANLLLARAVTRSRECAIRAALGAGRARLVRQMLVESVLLFLIGGALGVLVARVTVDSLLALAVTGGYVPERMAVAVDARVLLFTLAVSCIAGVMFGLVPALQASQVDVNEGLRASNPASAGGIRRRRATRLLIVSELAISVVLLVGCGLMIRSFLRVEASTGGIAVEDLLETQGEGGRSFPEALTFWRLVLDRVHQDRGVQVAAVTSRPPLHGSRWQTFSVEGRHSAGGDVQASDILISEDYFMTMGIPFLKGRAFSDKDSGGSTPVVIVSERLARAYFGNEEPLGKRVMLSERTPMLCCASAGPVDNVWREIVGVVADVRQGTVDEPPAMTIYRPYSQIVEHDMFLMVRARSAVEASRLAVELGPSLKAFDRSREWADVRPMRDIIRDSPSIRLRRFVLILFGIFAGLAIVLAAVGTYGVMSYAVADRTREIGIRMALGATQSTVIHHVLFDTVRLTLAGLVIGWFAAQGLTRFMTSMLFGITPSDAVTYIGVSCVLAGVAILAGYVPARRAATIDPVEALKHE